MTPYAETLRRELTNESLSVRADESILTSGRRYFHEGRVLSFEKDLHGFSCKVAGRSLHNVIIKVDSGNVTTLCDCGADGGECKHTIAALFAVKQMLPPQTERRVPGAVAFFEESFRFVPPSRAIQPALKFFLDLRGLFNREQSFGISARLGGVDPQFIPSFLEFIRCWHKRVPYLISDTVSYDPQQWKFPPAEEQLFIYLSRIIDEQNIEQEDARSLYLPATYLGTVLDFLDGHSIVVRYNSDNEESLTIDARNIRFSYALQDSGDGAFEVIPRFLDRDNNKIAPPSLQMLPIYPAWARMPGKLLRLAPQDAEALESSLRNYSGIPARLEVKREDASYALAELVPFLGQQGEVSYEGRMKRCIKVADKKPRPVVKADMEGLWINIQLFFRYGNKRIAWHDTAQLVRMGDYSWQERQPDAEQEMINILQRAGFRSDEDSCFILTEEEAIFRFIYEVLPAFQNQWEVLYSKKFQITAKRLSQPKIGLKLTKKYDFLELVIAPRQKGLVIDPSAVLASVGEGKSYVRLKDGQFLPLSDEQAALLKKLTDQVDFLPTSRGNSAVLKADGIYAPLVAATLEQEDESQIEADSSLLHYSEKLVHWKGREKVPGRLNATLREYQEDGFSWLANIYDNKLGGVLADDMGLGKTIQTISLVLHAVSQGETRPFLIVCPSSLVFNWVNEAKKFAPDLAVLSVNGSPVQRKKQYKEIKNHQVLVVSYSILQRDQEMLEKTCFAAVFLDEAQHIKNPGSSRTLSAKAIQAESRFALTGTPIENSLGELWSLFDFVLPGYLFTYRRFKEEVERPILEGQNDGVLQQFKQRISPFMLRRTKAQVLTQLPPMTEQVCACSMSEPQREAYLSVLAFFDTSLLPLLERDGIENHSLEILAALTKLRQICCHPGMAMEKYATAPSGKMDLLFELLNEAIDGGHKTLIFSQFTGMLDLVQQRMVDEGITQVRLDGSTGVKKREQIVRAFNEDPGMHAFLISLKAGGTGLNLTSADTVIHVDPWWNPAAEAQASARAYRMGQQRPVNVYKLIAEKSVEEKILALQNDKKRLFNAVVGNKSVNFKKFSLNQIRELFALP